MTKYIILMLGGALGTAARFFINTYTNNLFGNVFPFGTLAINSAGSFLIGLIWGFWESASETSLIRTFAIIGVLGGFTTFSSFSLETLNMLKQSQFKLALLNVFANNVLAIVSVFLGYSLSTVFYKLSRF